MKAVPLKLITNDYDYGYFQEVERTLVKRFQKIQDMLKGSERALGL
jgi:hypothetical protein